MCNHPAPPSLLVSQRCGEKWAELGGFIHQTLFSSSSGGEKFKIKVSAGPSLCEAFREDALHNSSGFWKLAIREEGWQMCYLSLNQVSCSYYKSRGGSSVSKALASQAWCPEVSFQNPQKKPGVVTWVCNPNNGKMGGWGRQSPWGSEAS